MNAEAASCFNPLLTVETRLSAGTSCIAAHRRIEAPHYPSCLLPKYWVSRGWDTTCYCPWVLNSFIGWPTARLWLRQRYFATAKGSSNQTRLTQRRQMCYLPKHWQHRSITLSMRSAEDPEMLGSAEKWLMPLGTGVRRVINSVA